jgi:hypothetical protein
LKRRGFSIPQATDSHVLKLLDNPALEMHGFVVCNDHDGGSCRHRANATKKSLAVIGLCRPATLMERIPERFGARRAVACRGVLVSHSQPLSGPHHYFAASSGGFRVRRLGGNFRPDHLHGSPLPDAPSIVKRCRLDAACVPCHRSQVGLAPARPVQMKIGAGKRATSAQAQSRVSSEQVSWEPWQGGWALA